MEVWEHARRHGNQKYSNVHISDVNMSNVTIAAGKGSEILLQDSTAASVTLTNAEALYMEKLHQAILEQLLLPEAPLSIAEGRPSISFINVAHKNINLIENEAIAILSSEDGESCTSACAKIGRSCDSLALASATLGNSAVWRFMPECSSVTVVESNAGNQPQIDVSDQSCTFSTAFSYCDAEADTNRHRGYVPASDFKNYLSFRTAPRRRLAMPVQGKRARTDFSARLQSASPQADNLVGG